MRRFDNVLNKTNGQAVMASEIEIKAHGVKKTAELTATDHAALIRATDVDRNVISLPENGVSITAKLADELGVKQGDRNYLASLRRRKVDQNAGRSAFTATRPCRVSA